MNAYVEEADLILISESGFVDGAQPYIEGYTQCGNVAKPIDKANASYYTGGVAAWKRQGPGPKILYRDQFSQVKGFQALKLVMESNIAIVCFYRSPNQSREEIEETIEFFKKIPENAILVGDLNIPEVDWIVNEIPKKSNCKIRREKEDLVLQLTIENNRRQRVNFATNKHNNNILDVVIAPNDVEIKNLKEISSPDKAENPGTDHKWFGFTIEREDGKSEKLDQSETKTTINYEQMNEILKNKEWKFQDCQEDDHSEDRCGLCELTSEIRMAEHMATTTVSHKKKFRKIPEGVMAEQKLRMEAAKEKRHISEIHRKRYKEESDLYDKMCKENYTKNQKAFEEGLKRDRNAIYRPLKDQNKGNIEALKDEDDILQTSPSKVVEVHARALTKIIAKEPRKVFRFEEIEEGVNAGRLVDPSGSVDHPQQNEHHIKNLEMDELKVKEAIKEIKPSKSRDANGISKEIIKNIQGAIIPCIAKLGRLSLMKNKIPNCQKVVHIIGIPKGSGSDKPEGIRPINLTSNILKVWERVIKNQIFPYLEEKKYFSDSQHGFRKGRSTQTCLTGIMSVVQRHVSRGAYMIALDFSKAFDVLNHEILLQEINKAGIKGDAFKWIGDWLTGNDFRCRIKGALSKPRNITSGCRQGSTLGPGLFLIFINSLLRILPTENTYCYADDITLVMPYGAKNEPNEEKLQKMLDDCTKWSKETGLEFNVKKCYILHIGNRKITTPEFQLCEMNIAETTKTSILGVWFTGRNSDPMAEMKSKTVRDGNVVFKKLKTYFKKSSFNTIKRVYNAYFTSKTLYGSEFFEDYTIVNNTYNSNSSWRNYLDRLYIRMFANKRPNKDDLNNVKGSEHVMPLMPSQQSIVKSLVWAIKILSGKLINAGIDLEKVLEVNKHRSNSVTRSHGMTMFDRSTSRSEYHDAKLSILRRHKSLIKELLGNKEYGEILKMSVKEQKIKIDKFIRNKDTKQNRIRNEIKDGTYFENHYHYQL